MFTSQLPKKRFAYAEIVGHDNNKNMSVCYVGMPPKMSCQLGVLQAGLIRLHARINKSASRLSTVQTSRAETR